MMRDMLCVGYNQSMAVMSHKKFLQTLPEIVLAHLPPALQGIEVRQPWRWLVQFHYGEPRLHYEVSRPPGVQGLELGNSRISFRARFGGRPHLINLPPGAVLAVYARETGDGMLLGDAEQISEPSDDEPPPEPPAGDDKASRRAHLKVVK